MTPEETLEIVKTAYEEAGQCHEDMSEEFQIISESKWQAEYKYNMRKIVISYENHFIEIKEFRTGSHWSGYDYLDPAYKIVHPVERTYIVYE